MGFLTDLAPGQPPALHLVRRVPGPVRLLFAREQTGGSLLLWWKRPAGGTWVDGYRIERTPQGRDYELLGTT